MFFCSIHLNDCYLHLSGCQHRTPSAYTLFPTGTRRSMSLSTPASNAYVHHIRFFAFTDCPSRSCHQIGLASYTNNTLSFIAKRVTRPTNISILYPFSAITPAHYPPKMQHLSSLNASHPLAPSRKSSSSLYL